MKKTALAAAAAVTFAVAGTSSAQTATVTPSNDTWIRDGFSHTVTGPDGALNAFATFVPYIQFDLSGLNIDDITNATLSLNLPGGGSRNDTLNAARFGVQGLPAIDGNTNQLWDELSDFDPTDATNGLDFRNVGLEWGVGFEDGVDYTRLVNLDPERGASTTEVLNDVAKTAVLTGSDLVSFLNTRVDDNGYVTFLLPFSDGTANNRGFGYASKDNANPALAPALTLTYTALETPVPEPTTATVALMAGGLLLGRRRRA